MIFSGKSIELYQPNSTVRGLIQRFVQSQGGEVQFEVEQGSPCLDLLIVDVHSMSVAQVKARQRAYQEQDAAVLWTGLPDGRAMLQDDDVWLGRPFSPQGLRSQCVALMGGDDDDSGGDDYSITKERMRPRGGMLGVPVTEEVEFDDASLLEEEFGLEPGVLGGARPVSRDEDVGEATVLTSLTDMYGDADIDELVDHDLIHGGSWSGVIESEGVELEGLSSRELSLGAPLDVENNERSNRVTIPQLPSASRDEGATEAQLPSHVLPLPEESSVVEESEPSVAKVSGRVAGSSVGLDDETSVELRAFSRMFAKSLSRLTLNARMDDRFDHVHRVLQALFLRGLDGAASELHRLPSVRGFSGDLRSLSLMGVFHTIRDRGLRGKLEVSDREQSYVLYLDGSHLYDIDALVGDHDQLLLEIVREHNLVDEATYQQVMLMRKEQGPLAPGVEMMFRESRLFSEVVFKRVLALKAMEIFRRACQVRDGHFAFIEFVEGSGLPWPVQDLGLDVDELLLELLRQDAVETGVSEATASAHLMPNMGRVRGLNQNVLTPAEREVLNVFKGGESLEIARGKLSHLGRELDGIINRLKRANLLLRVEGVPHYLRTSSQQDAVDMATLVSDDDIVASEPSGMMRDERSNPLMDVDTNEIKKPTRPLRSQDRTVVADINARVLDARSTQEEEALHKEDVLRFPRIGEGADQSDIPTRSVKGHELIDTATVRINEEDEAELARLLVEIASEAEEENSEDR